MNERNYVSIKDREAVNKFIAKKRAKEEEYEKKLADNTKSAINQAEKIMEMLINLHISKK